MGSLRIIKSGLLTTIQDKGRVGYSYYAISSGGVMDRLSADHTNLIIGNEADYPIIECTSVAPTFEFLTSGYFAVGGADCKYTLNGNPIHMYSCIKANKGDFLSGGNYLNGLRGYIALNGKINREKYLNSISYHSYPYNDLIKSSKLGKNDIIQWQSESVPNLNVELKSNNHFGKDIKIERGPEFDFLSHEKKEQFLNESFQITNHSNRMGIRLSGPELLAKVSHLKESVPVFPGIIQLTPQGQLIIILQDGQTTGGYPRIAYIRTNELNKLNQVKIGEEINFCI